jgi:hypothetical protein
VYDRREQPASTRIVCDVLFDAGSSANENSVVATGRSIVVQNWYGAPDSILSDDHRSLVPGLMRIDVREDESGCDVVWYTRELATPATAKLSTATGLTYGVMLDRSIAPENVYYAYAIDFRTGETAYRVRLGVGPASNIQFSPTYVGRDGPSISPCVPASSSSRTAARRTAHRAGRKLDAAAPQLVRGKVSLTRSSSEICWFVSPGGAGALGGCVPSKRLY